MTREQHLRNAGARLRRTGGYSETRVRDWCAEQGLGSDETGLVMAGWRTAPVNYQYVAFRAGMVVYDVVDPRFEGRVRACFAGAQVRVDWLREGTTQKNGWYSDLPAYRLERVNPALTTR